VPLRRTERDELYTQTDGDGRVCNNNISVMMSLPVVITDAIRDSG